MTTKPDNNGERRGDPRPGLGTGRGRRRLLAAAFAAAVTGFAPPAVAQQEPQDRVEFERAAARVVFQNQPIAQAGAFVAAPQPAAARPAAQAPADAPRRPVRVVLPSPYGR